jgi:hypothetical protein
MALEGSLRDMSMVDLFQIFRMGPKSGILLLAAGPERGVVYVAQGRPVDAVLVRGPERQVISSGEDAVILLLQWDDATFTFRHDPAVRERPVRIFHDSDWLILEGMRRRENPLRMLPHQCITMETRLEMATLPSSAENGVNLDLNQWRILSQIAISQNMREICEKTGMASEQAIRMVTELVAIGLVGIAQETHVPPPRQRLPATAVGHQLQPMIAGVGGQPGVASQPTTTPGRGLLGAIMRRVRGL